MIQRQHNVSEPIPPFYIRTLIGMEASLNNALAKEKEAKKKMNATNAKALTAMKQKVKKASKEYEIDIQKYHTVCTILNIMNLYSKRYQDPEAFERDYTALTTREAPASAPSRSTGPRAEGEADDDFTTVGKGGKSMLFTSESIYKNLQAVQEARGKKVITQNSFRIRPDVFTEH